MERFMKKTAALLIALCMMAVVIGNEREVYAKDACVFSVEADDSASDLRIGVTGNPGIATFRFRISYDTEHYQAVSVTKGKDLDVGSFSSNIDEKNGSVVVLWYYTSGNWKANGNLATVHFKALSGQTSLADTGYNGFFGVPTVLAGIRDRKNIFHIKGGGIYNGKTV